MQDAWRAYLELALGLTEASRKRAQSVARKLVGQSGVTAAQLQAFAEELLSTGLANREALTKLVRFEVDRALGVVGLATAEEVADLTERVRHLERELAQARAQAPTAPAAAEPPPVGASTGKLAKKAVAKKAARAAATTGAGTVAGQGDAPQPERPGKAVAKKAVAKKATAKKATTARKTTGQREPGSGTAPE
jgi:polyhydroxyalkanoate synthesis regulator phasin